MKTIREKPHRLPREHYRGNVTVAFTLCLRPREPLFISAPIVNVFADYLRSAADKCDVQMIYTFMPEHLHVISMGRSEESDGLTSIEIFKQTTGWWLRNRQPEVQWQKSFWDRIARSTYEEAQAAWYLVNNPVRRGLVEEWTDYPFTGGIGLDLKEFLADLLPFP